MALSFETLITPMTREEVEASIYRVLALVGVSTTSWKPGAVVRTLIVATSVLFAACTTLIAEIAKSGFLELAEGNWLRIVAHYVYGVDFEPATFASGPVVLSNSGGGIYAWDPEDLIVTNTVTGKTYRNTAAVSLGAGQTGLSIVVRAVEAGSDSSAAPGEIAALETPQLGVTVINLGALVGTDDEEDPALRIRCYEKQGSVSPNGPRDAYSYICKGAKRSDGTSCGVTRVWVSKNSEASHVDVICATASGVLTGDLADPSTDLGAVNLAIQTLCVPDGVSATLASGSIASISVTWEAWIKASAGLSVAEVVSLVDNRLAAFMSTQPIGGHVIPPASGRVYLDAIRTAIGAAHAGMVHVVVTLPAADVPISVGGIPTLGVSTCTAVHTVAE